MREIDEGQRWLEQAKEDLKWVRLLLTEGGFHLVCFLSQQVAEKALKAILYAQGEEMVLGHSVERLCAQVSLHLPKIREQAMRWAVLDGYYVTTRYPNSLPGSIPARVYQKDAAQEALSLAEEVVIFVEEQLG
ncbi:HEPN domain-containing protein [Candidatus Bipolaricaulota bacterium]|nr:HEPN domain-containing protein [Candidatus Bipolaricaulota bacterium]